MDYSSEQLRDSVVIEKDSQIRDTVIKHLMKKALKIKGAGDATAVIMTLNADSSILVNCSGINLEELGLIRFYRVMARYMEIDCTLVKAKHENQNSLYLLKINSIKIAKTARQGERVNVESVDIQIMNIRVSTKLMNLSAGQLPPSVNVALLSYENKLRHEADIVKIEVFNKADPLHYELFLSKKVLYVQDCEKADQYSPPDPRYFDYGEFLGNKLQQKILQTRQKKILSEIMVPIKYVQDNQSVIPFGFIYYASRSHHFSEDDVQHVQENSFEIIETILDSNTLLVEEKQKVQNVSQNGLRVLITDPSLKRFLLNQKSFTFDIRFEKLPHLNLYGFIRSVFKADNDNFSIGVELLPSPEKEKAIALFKYREYVKIIQNRLAQKS